MTTKHRITVNLDEAEYEQLSLMARDMDRSLAWIGRQAICNLIKRREQTDAPLFAGLHSADKGGQPAQ